MKTFLFTAQVEIKAKSEGEARRVFDKMREACLPSQHGVLLFDLRRPVTRCSTR